MNTFLSVQPTLPFDHLMSHLFPSLLILQPSNIFVTYILSFTDSDDYH